MNAGRVLIVDDNVDSAQALAMLLELEGYEISLAHDGISGLAQIDAEQPSVVLCDISLPGMDGYQIAESVATRESRPMMIAMTGHADAAASARASAAGFDLYLVKPFDLDTLLLALQRI